MFAVALGCTPPAGEGKKDTALELTPPEITWQASADPIERAPIALTTSDGAGLALVSLQVRTVIEEPLAFTELHMKFLNPEDRRREGRFEITLPQEAAVSRFAMRIGDELREGEVVERKRAAQVYEDFLHRKQDPALLEKDAGNEFAARVFPIDANEQKEIVLSYSEELGSRAEPYRVLLQGLPVLDAFSVDIRVGSNNDKPHSLSFSKANYAPTGDLEVRLPKQKPMALRNGELVVARVVPVLSLPPAKIDGLTVMFDTSASRALGFGAQIDRTVALVKELQARAGNDFDLSVVAFDQDSQEIYSGAASGFGSVEKAALLKRGALGASSYDQAFAYVTRVSSTNARVLLVSDGVVTAGVSDTTGLREAVAKLAAHGATRLDVLAEGGIQDRDTLRALTGAGLRDAGAVLDAREPVAQLADRMLLGVRDQVEVHIAGASWVHPSVLTNVQAGDERLVFAELPSDVPVQIELLGAGAEAFDTRETPRPLLERAWSRAKIASLTGELNALSPSAATERGQKERAIVELSVKQRVLSDFTALLVLESEYDYQRYNIPRDALSNILTIGDDGIELRKRDSGVLQIAKGRDDKPTDDGDFERRPVAEGSVANDEIAAQAPSGAPAVETKQESAKRSRSIAEEPAVEPEAMRPATAAAPKPMSAPAPAPPPSPAKAALEADKSARANDMLDRVSGIDVAANEASTGSLGTSGGSLRTSGSLGGGNGSGRGKGDLQIAGDGLSTLEASARIHGGAVEGLPADEARAALRSATSRAKQCYARSGASGAPGESQRMSFELSISDKGTVSDAFVTSGTLDDRTVQNCILAALRQVRFPKPSGTRASIVGGIELSMVLATPQPGDEPMPIAMHKKPRPAAKIPTPSLDDAYEGVLADVLRALERSDSAGAVQLADKAVSENPGDVIALVALGEALEAEKDFARAARAYGSLIDLFPSRADMRRMAGERLESIPGESSAGLAIDTYTRALAQRPDHPSSHRLLAYAQLKLSQPRQAFETLERALERNYRSDRFEGADRILREDLGLVGAAWLRSDATMEGRILQGLAAHGAVLDKKPSLRFVLNWETDANDVDFHIYDGRGGHAFYQKPKLASGGALYADITSGYGPECFAIPGSKRAYPYVLQAHYFARGPMGFGMGKLQVIEHTGDGNLLFAEHPFVIMKDKAFVELARTSGLSARVLEIPSGQHH